MDWIAGVQSAIRYIDDNITEDLDYGEIAKRAYVSSFHFQRAFGFLCGFTLGEYIRNRRLTLAGMELSTGEAKVVDVAVKYGYDSPDSFTKAFTRFHGISPSSAKKEGAKLKSLLPLQIKFSLKGGNVMDYRIEAKEAFTAIGTAREFSGESSATDIPKFWCEHFEAGNGKYICGMYGICYDNDVDANTFGYMIADVFDADKEYPKEFTKKEVPAKTWAVFPVKGAIPKALQNVNKEIWDEWLPNCREYELDGNIGIEMYTAGDMDSADYYSEIWIPVRKK